MTVGILLPCDGTEPQPLAVVDALSDIQACVNGLFDVVRADIDPTEFGINGHDEITIVGYVNDEGLLMGLPENPMASIIFNRRLVGNVVVLCGTSPSGVYDGENYDVPSWFADLVFEGTLHSLAYMNDENVETTRSMAEIMASAIADALTICVKGGFLTVHEAQSFLMMLGSCETKEQAQAAANATKAIMDFAQFYMTAKPNAEDVRRIVDEERAEIRASKILPDGITEDMIASFFNEINKEGE